MTEKKPTPPDPQLKKKPVIPGRFRFSIWYALLAVLLILTVRQFTASSQAELTYTQFLRYVAEDRVSSVAIGEDEIQGVFSVVPDTLNNMAFSVVPIQDDSLLTLLDGHGVAYEGVVPSPWPRILSWVLPMVVLVGLWFFILRRMGGAAGGVMNIGKNKAKVFVETDTKVTFTDVAGIDEAEEEVKEIVEFLKTPERFRRLGGRIPKGVLLVGPPGTGKTLLARAVAGESGVPFFNLSGSDFVEMFVGVGAARVRDLFQQAKERSPCIVFIDELDAMGKSRGGNPLSSHDEREQTLNQLLVEMDGFDANVNIIIMAATNRPETLDTALLRPGRFDRQIVVDRPDIKGREEILRVHAREIRLAPEVDLHTLAARTPGMVGADLANIVNEAALLAARKGIDAVTMSELDEAADRAMGGLERKSRVLTDRERKLTAYYEAGHALVAECMEYADPVHRISIVPRGVAALGNTMYLPTEDRYLMSREELEDRMGVLLGGHVTVEVIFNETLSTAGDDFKKATSIAQHMVKDYGMSDLGLVAYGEQPTFLGQQASTGSTDYGEETAALIDEEVKRIVESNLLRVREVVTRYQHALHVIADRLIERESLLGEELRRLLAEQGVPISNRQDAQGQDQTA